MKKKEQWIKYFNIESVNRYFHKKINGKNIKMSAFHYFASEEHRHDPYLNILNLHKYGWEKEVPKEIIDLKFMQDFFAIKNTIQVFKIPYIWKNTMEDKKLMQDILNFTLDFSTDYRNIEMCWQFEEGFWSDLNYTKEIRKKDFDHLNLVIVKYLNQTTNKDELAYLLSYVNENCYYLKHIKNKHKSLLSEKTILKYAKDYGLVSLTEEQKNRYEVMKEAFNNFNIAYDSLNSKWKTSHILKDLLNNKYVWKTVVNNKSIVDINQLTPDLLADRELIKSCLSEGFNLIKLKHNYPDYYYDKELKNIALSTYNNYQIIEDCPNDNKLILQFIKNFSMKNNIGLSLNAILSDTVNISEEMFKDRQIMENYFKIEKINTRVGIPHNVVKALESYSFDEIVDLIIINPVVYELLSEELRSNWELLKVYSENNEVFKSMFVLNNVSEEIQHKIEKIPENMKKEIFSTFNYEQRCIIINNNSLNTKLHRTLGKKPRAIKIKI